MGSTTGFSEDAVTAINHSRDQLFAPLGSGVQDIPTIANFLAKPKVLFTSTWLSSDTSNTIETSFSVARELRESTRWMEKLSGYRFMRGTAVVRVELDAQPFIAGKLLIHFLPQFEARSSNAAFTSKNQTLTSKTQQYSIELDARDSCATLRIPYISPYSHCPIRSSLPEYDWGTVFITVLSPCTSAASISVPYTVLLSFEDVELEGPTAQSGKSRKMNQVLKMERKNLANKGIVSSTLDNLVDPVSYFKNVPFIGEFVDTTTNILKGASGILQAFGWSKPIEMRHAMPVVRKPNRYFTNFNGANEATNLALDAGCSLAQYDGLGGLSEDEMSFGYLKMIPAYVGSFNWAVGDASNANLFNVDISPSTLITEKSNVLTSTYITKYAPPFGYISKYFKFWRGSINITLKFVKTQFHIGKVMVSFDIVDPSSPDANTVNSQNALREVIDLKDSSEVTLNLPYFSNQNYLEYGDISGILAVRVLNPLLASSTVSSQIEVLVYASAGEDYEVACPIDRRNPAVVAQMNTVDKVLVNKRIGGYPQTKLSMAPVASSIGETFVSLKQLLLLGRYVNRTNAISPFANFPSTGFSALTWWPWTFGIPNAATSVLPIYEVPPLSGDYLSELAQGFAFYRGGIRYQFPSNSSSTVASAYLVSNEGRISTEFVAPASTFGIPNITLGRIGTTSSGVPPVTTLKPTAANHCEEGTLDILVPYQGTTPMRFTHLSVGPAPEIPVTRDVNSQLLVVATTTPAVSSLDQRGMMRCAADDFSLIYFCGFSGFL